MVQIAGIIHSNPPLHQYMDKHQIREQIAASECGIIIDKLAFFDYNGIRIG
ncbi:hypothetical protein UNSWDHB_2178 [Dehalobacter sp. UNSWDHB]|nr:hypothetical protein UNSWDHB_2178 [Dehalobacter sp. UNSWDHB]